MVVKFPDREQTTSPMVPRNPAGQEPEGANAAHGFSRVSPYRSVPVSTSKGAPERIVMKGEIQIAFGNWSEENEKQSPNVSHSTYE